MNQFVKDMLIDQKIYDLEFVQDTSKYDPEELIQMDGYNYKFNDRGLTSDEVKIALLAKQNKTLLAIKNILMFYLCCSLTAAGIYIIYLLYILSKK